MCAVGAPPGGGEADRRYLVGKKLILKERRRNCGLLGLFGVLMAVVGLALAQRLDSMTLMVSSNLNYSIYDFPHHISLSGWQEEALWLFSPSTHSPKLHFSHSPSMLEERCRQRVPIHLIPA